MHPWTTNLVMHPVEAVTLSLEAAASCVERCGHWLQYLQECDCWSWVACDDTLQSNRFAFLSSDSPSGVLDAGPLYSGQGKGQRVSGVMLKCVCVDMTEKARITTACTRIACWCVHMVVSVTVPS